jgi:hypothetical protein
MNLIHSGPQGSGDDFVVRSIVPRYTKETAKSRSKRK